MFRAFGYREKCEDGWLVTSGFEYEFERAIGMAQSK
jgi:hypothetical protein